MPAGQSPAGPHPLAPCGAHFLGHLTSTVFCRGAGPSPAPLQARCYTGSGVERSGAGVPGLQQALPALLPALETSALALVWPPCECTSLRGWPQRSLWPAASAALGVWRQERASFPARPHWPLPLHCLFRPHPSFKAGVNSSEGGARVLRIDG